MTQTKIHFYSNPNSGPSSLILHKTEWDRLTRQRNPQEERDDNYLQDLIEQSQAWLKNWSDTVEGCVAKADQKREQQRIKQLATIKEFANRNVGKNNAEVIQRARQQIFEESCYGKKLVSALLESRDQEEREAQINLKKEIKQKQMELELKKAKTVTFCTFDLDKDEDTVKEKRKSIEIENSKTNKEMFEKQKEQEAKSNEKRKQGELKDAQLMKRLLELEDEAAIYKEHQDTEIMKINYNTTKQLQLEQKKQFDDFIEKYNKKGEHRAAKRERRNKEKTKQDRKNNKTIAEFNKSMAEAANQWKGINKRYCDRQSAATSPYFQPQRRLIAELRRREKEPSPWSGSETLDLQFFKNAERTLSECKNKITARRVINVST
ncbi:hypothetical protein HF086_010004 [Spodoptera exigua]|uniref:Uncharacterized protein n=1 Tax=Spodoptera exigua TaxID=7107 RepID=A0A922MMS4_SPOEX|nr:hypothetical protein HF086_010004 [Spodoptera exigua]